MSESLSFLPLPEMPLLPITSEATVRACRELPVSPETDVLVCSYLLPQVGHHVVANVGLSVARGSL